MPEPSTAVHGEQDAKIATAPQEKAADKLTSTQLNHHPGASFGLVTKPDLAEQLKLSVRSVDNLVRRRAIPVIRLSARCVRFHLPSVLAALRKFEVKEAGRRG